VFCGNAWEERRRKERMMSRCFIWFPIGGYRRTQYITSISLFYKNVGRLWRVSDCEELLELSGGAVSDLSIQTISLISSIVLLFFQKKRFFQSSK